MPCGQIVDSPDELQSKVYPNIQQNFKDQNWLSHRAILASINDVVEKLNVAIQKQLPGQEFSYKSIDFILNEDEAVQYPIDFLNSIQTPDLQAHNLILIVGAPIRLMRNIDAPRLCNGTRLIVKKLMQHVIQATLEIIFDEEYTEKDYLQLDIPPNPDQNRGGKETDDDDTLVNDTRNINLETTEDFHDLERRIEISLQETTEISQSSYLIHLGITVPLPPEKKRKGNNSA
ncbi:ATP-dependent DNA helicase [Trichonephila inaurata madagascariensis]|uniref:ATP-dependent DNA helicase n=1 Tax=Trichonephila inaurata madagascariensis TaxID=2747483 RepID=A0A8X7C6Z0_9ARAC|nr:ATP-dependent DNA helicase [Trichonephila inaurata madagascariensis]